jgi:DNA segregation ATPase FtsK/SpoIIIE, S-DNA-T family
MTDAFNTFNHDAAHTAPSGFRRFLNEFALLLGAALWLFCFIALITHSLQDAAWSTTGHRDGGRHNWAGSAGAWLADIGYYFFGMSVWWWVLAAGHAWVLALLRWLRAEEAPSPHARPRALRWALFWLGMALLLSASAVLEWSRFHRWDALLPGEAGGSLGSWLGPLAVHGLGTTGSALLSIALLVMAMAWVFRFSWAQAAESLGRWIDAWIATRKERSDASTDARLGERAAQARAMEESLYQAHHPAHPVHLEPSLAEPEEAPAAASPRPAATSAPKPVAKAPARPAPAAPMAPSVPQATAFAAADPAGNKLPQIDLLDSAARQQATVSPETLEMTSRLIEKKLGDFGVEVQVVAAQPGPVITRYEIEPATGVKGSQVVNLAKDLARSLSLVSIRVVETIPGKNLMALELPNARRQTIKLSEILGSGVYAEAKSLLTMGLGKDIAGQPVVADLAKMPHCLVAGTTGSGKSVGINAMILSLLYKADPKDVRLLLIDPKMLELSVYEGIPHLLAPVVTDMKQAAQGLNWCVAEMEKRYRLMSKLGVRNLAGYNAKIDESAARGDTLPNPFSLTPEEPEPLARMPYIVVVIDELADLMMVVGKKIEELIARLAQKARAAGIHLILATQRPSVDVITGLIKANIPTRLSFQVSSKIDSRTILDQMGAEALLGMGDMLYMPSGTGFPTRVHGAFVSDDEVHRVVAYLKAQYGEPDYLDEVLDGGAESEGGGADGLGDAEASGEKDPMYDQAVAIVLQDRKASISYVQRKLKIGYNRAARLLEDMEHAGLVSALTTSGQRDILVASRAAE